MAMPDGTRNISNVLVSNAEKWGSEGWGGAIVIDDNNAFSFFGVVSSLNVEEAKLSLEPVVSYLKSVASETNPYVASVISVPGHHAIHQIPQMHALWTAGIGFTVARSTRLLPRDNFKPDRREELVDVLVQQPWVALLAAPTNYQVPESDQPGSFGHSAVTPAWVRCSTSLNFPQSFFSFKSLGDRGRWQLVMCSVC
jgi:hypothetical protein